MRRPPSRPSALARLVAAARSRLEALDARHPDGPLAAYRWLWRALEKSSGRSRWLLRIRFAGAVLQDLALLGLWCVLRPCRTAVRSPSVRATLAAGLLLVVGITMRGLVRHPATASVQATASTAPQAPPKPETAPTEPPGPTIEHADIGIVPNGSVRFQGQFMKISDLVQVVRYYHVRTALVEVEHDTPWEPVLNVVKALTRSKTDFRMTRVDRLTPPATRRPVRPLARPLPPTAR